MLVQLVRQDERETMKEARLAGCVEVYENLMNDLERFAEKQLREK